MRHLPVRDFAGFAMDETAGMGDLPGAPTEVREAAANFPGRAVCLVGADATVAAVRAHATGSRFVHFATHGVVNDRRPLYSGLPLAPGGDTSFLHAYEMFSLDLSADVVVCSACETAVGESRAGEGIVGLSYALFAAGAKAVLLSRWPVRDLTALRLMRELYRELARNAPPADALHTALGRARRRHPGLAHPREWAGFLLLDTSVPGTSPHATEADMEYDAHLHEDAAEAVTHVRNQRMTDADWERYGELVQDLQRAVDTDDLDQLARASGALEMLSQRRQEASARPHTGSEPQRTRSASDKLTSDLLAKAEAPSSDAPEIHPTPRERR